MKLFRATISTAGLRADQVYEVEDDTEARAKQLIEAGFLVHVSKKAVKELDDETTPLSDADDGSVPAGDTTVARHDTDVPKEGKANAARTGVPEVPEADALADAGLDSATTKAPGAKANTPKSGSGNSRNNGARRR